MMKLDDFIETLRQGKHIDEDSIYSLCLMAQELLMNESNVTHVDTPVTICGDIHGQLHDLLTLFAKSGGIEKNRYIFLGDFVDRGFYSLESFLLLVCYKLRYPDRIVLIRGNHETRQITKVYGFYDEVVRKYGNSNVWRYCCEVFDYLPLGAIVNNKVFCVHGGLSPDVLEINEIRAIDRKKEVPHEGAMCDLLWSDPEDVDTWSLSPRGAGFLFGHNEVNKFLHTNNVELIARAHQLVMEGYKEMFDGGLVTVWSAPNYCYRCGNVAAVLRIDDNIEKEYTIFEAVRARDSGGNVILPTKKPQMDYFL
ncbi:phosphoprotein phosphatase PP4 catalytic subunit [Kluyveromyces marxianus]|uniref:Serine/threonine-protein phosphatase n=2 Tax=Kluyveromyces marxianus TaxID=4911 RepID=W0T4F0_KLUMD|nr:serine/threonine-protein phosphatase 4 catalytic subunit [Kluyveromyces marxianus DMKU3-1042]KAG0670193.1 phosphoprotein phosphatase PP4 catalytic subunit [Kluyveromyces marxianus]KAG0682112.1 phosphoprotein phosphatase PP4 catalytic subunit [Kluyveromyces marxianus]QGN14214.1 serine/threonine-protein phosphatase 4 catalytic subunit [Kluyveromyces marxianus]BAO38477.1 serine/threonine-protein phosphatase 4 catalytic subunit [Kluyveromyces marxianus DMKU3-1042]BAP70029.1 serine/threonine-pro